MTHVVSALGFTIAGKEALDLASAAAHRELQQLERHLLESRRITGFSHEFIVREGNVWEQLQDVIRAKQIDLVVVGTPARRGIEKIVLGSVAEEIFRQSNCPVLTVGPGSAQMSPIESSTAVGPFVFATDFGSASLKRFAACHLLRQSLWHQTSPSARCSRGAHSRGFPLVDYR